MHILSERYKKQNNCVVIWLLWTDCLTYMVMNLGPSVRVGWSSWPSYIYVLLSAVSRTYTDNNINAFHIFKTFQVTISLWSDNKPYAWQVLSEMCTMIGTRKNKKKKSYEKLRHQKIRYRNVTFVIINSMIKWRHFNY